MNKKYILVSNTKSILKSTEDGEKAPDSYKEMIDPNKTTEKSEMYKYLKNNLQEALLSENLIILTGAGSSIGEKSGKSMSKLWETVKKKVDEFNEIVEFVNYNEENLEELLSMLQTAQKFHSDSNKRDESDKSKNYISSITTIIKEECSFKLTDELPHQLFLQKILKSRKKSSPRLKIFTLNYDKCFEEAGDKIGAVINDGFSFSSNSKFRSTDFDLDIVHREQTRIHNEENFYDKVFHLYKLHGSVNWELKDNEIQKNNETDTPLLIYPNSAKYESSYQMPFFEMISRLQVSLRTPNTNLFIIGYGFGDNHINRIIEESLQTNVNLNVFIINNSIKEDTSNPFRAKLFKFAQKHTGLTLIADNFANFTANLPNTNFEENENIRNLNK